MSVLTPLGILILAMLIMAFLELTPGVFILFYHYTIGRFSRKSASRLSLFFILGTEIISACLFLSVYFLTSILFFDHPDLRNNVLTWIIVGVLFALSFASFFFYFRRGPGTRLFIPREFANTLIHYAKTVKTTSDAFVLGALTGVLELMFTLPLYIITSAEIMRMNNMPLPNTLLTIIYILSPVVSLFIKRWLFQSGRNLAQIERSRIKDKNFTRVLLGSSYFIIAILIICFRIN
ncbi:hypothetical protein IKG33_01350 [Candidatus Saccharibacteria bacterium]|nr:hypothetical protein [Candidatus Saccharibacteria bacterium]